MDEEDVHVMLSLLLSFVMGRLPTEDTTEWERGVVTWYDHDYIIIYFLLSYQWIAIDDGALVLIDVR
jgi:hypothetical protein